jgi:hypothetical protein
MTVSLRYGSNLVPLNPICGSPRKEARFLCFGGTLGDRDGELHVRNLLLWDCGAPAETSFCGGRARYSDALPIPHSVIRASGPAKRPAPAGVLSLDSHAVGLMSLPGSLPGTLLPTQASIDDDRGRSGEFCHS